MKTLLAFITLLSFAKPLLALDKQNYRIVKNKKTVEIQIDGNFPNPHFTDVLFVIDDSGSMSPHQNRLKEQADILADKAQKNKSLFNIGVTTTSTRINTGSMQSHSGELVGTPNIIDENTPDLVNALKNNFLVGTNGDTLESVFAPAMKALAEPLVSTLNKGFYREGAHLSLVFLTDTEDQSDISSWEFANFLMQLKHDDRSKISVQSLHVPTGTNSAICKGEGRDPTKIEEVVRIFDGSVYSLCSETYAANIEEMADEIFKPSFSGPYNPGVKIDKIELLGNPILSTLRVTFGNQVIAEDKNMGWSYDVTKNQLLFSQKIVWQPQSNGTTIKVSYEVL